MLHRIIFFTYDIFNYHYSYVDLTVTTVVRGIKRRGPDEPAGHCIKVIGISFENFSIGSSVIDPATVPVNNGSKGPSISTVRRLFRKIAAV